MDSTATISHSVRFARRIAGNIGESLEDSASSWNVNAADAMFEEDSPPLASHTEPPSV